MTSALACTASIALQRALPESAKTIIADHNSGAAPAGVGICPNPRGWYHSVAGIADTGHGLVATYRFSDSHTALYTHIMSAGSQDGGRTWSGHQSIAHRNVLEHKSCWVAPQLTRLRDGRLVIICDEGERTSGKDWPLLTRWQQRPERGMSNSLFWSSDDGRTWSEPQRIDEVGGEPGYITELTDGTTQTTIRLTGAGIRERGFPTSSSAIVWWCWITPPTLATATTPRWQTAPSSSPTTPATSFPASTSWDHSQS